MFLHCPRPYSICGKLAYGISQPLTTVSGRVVSSPGTLPPVGKDPHVYRLPSRFNTKPSQVHLQDQKYSNVCGASPLQFFSFTVIAPTMSASQDLSQRNSGDSDCPWPDLGFIIVNIWLPLTRPSVARFSPSSFTVADFNSMAAEARVLRKECLV